MAGQFEIREQFYLNGKPFKIISGAIHYFRVPRAYWRDRLEKLRAMGCNTVETYVPWNLHEPQKGHFDFDGMLDLAAFLRTAQELGLWAIVRPSPYICGEWEFGALPAWLLTEADIKLRCSNKAFLDCVQRFYDKLLPLLLPLQITAGGPILMMQVENEYGSYGDDTTYLEALRDMMRAGGVTVPLFTSDGPWGDYLDNGLCPGLLQTGNFGSGAPEQFPILQKHIGPDKPLMCMEFWDGWFDAWGDEAHHTTDAATCAKELDEILKRGSVNIYMFHGGTNFGFTNGSNYYEQLSPDVTSYDYDAPVAEDGSLTPKFHAMREVVGNYAPLPPLEFSTKIERRAFGSFPVTEKVSLFRCVQALSETHRSAWPQSMERLGQNFGYILYSTSMTGYHSATLQLMEANDRAQVFFDGKPVHTFYDHELEQPWAIPEDLTAQSRMDILVENMGRVNYGPKMPYQRKGIDGAVLLDRHTHFGWDMHPLPLDAAMCKKIDFSAGWEPGVPAFYRIPFTVDAPADTYLDLSGWGKGCALINGFNLGRFWEKGPQQRLYLPAPLLHAGENELLVFETEGRAGQQACFAGEPALG